MSIIPKLQNHLDILTKCPGIYPTESIVQFNKPKLEPYFGALPQYSQINEELIAPYFTPGSDINLKRIAMKNKSKYLMSTSTITAMLNHIYYAIANFKSPHFSGLSESYDHEPLKFMLSQRKPNSIFLRQLETDDGQELFSIDSDAGFTEPSNEVLLKMGKYLEKMFTTDADYFNHNFVLDPETNKPKSGAKY